MLIYRFYSNRWHSKYWYCSSNNFANLCGFYHSKYGRSSICNYLFSFQHSSQKQKVSLFHNIICYFVNNNYYAPWSTISTINFMQIDSSQQSKLKLCHNYWNGFDILQWYGWNGSQEKSSCNCFNVHCKHLSTISRYIFLMNFKLI